MALLGLVLLAVVGGAGVWIAVTDPLGESRAALVPAAEEGNLLGEAWSFESTETTSPSAAWVVPDEAPTGFSFVEAAAVTGQAGARALPGDDGWAAILSAETFRLPPSGGLLQFSATSSSDNLSLRVRYLAVDRPPLDAVLASGKGRLVGHSRPPPGSTSFRVGVSAVGEASVDDLDLRFVTEQTADPSLGDRPAGRERSLTGKPREHGLYTVYVGDPRGLTVFHGEELMLRIDPASLRMPDGASIPARAGFLPGTGAIAGPGGVRVLVATELVRDGRRLVLAERFSEVPQGAVVLHQAVISGALAAAPLGIRSARGFERFTGDFRVEGVDALLMGPTRKRLVLEMGAPFTLAASHREDGSIGLSIELVEGVAQESGRVALDVALQAEFKQERVAAAQLIDSAKAHEQAGRLGAALSEIDIIVRDYPYDEGVLEAGLAARARIQGVMQVRLDSLDADLEDALFLGVAMRCREVHADALALAQRFAGCEAEALFLQRAEAVQERSARLLEEDVLRRRQRVEALADSYAAHGDYPLLAEELQRYVDEHLVVVLSADAEEPVSPAGASDEDAATGGDSEGAGDRR